MPRRLVLPLILTVLLAVTVEGWFELLGAWSLLVAFLFSGWVAYRMFTLEEDGRG